MDNLSQKERSWNMSLIKSKNTKPEIAFRKALFKLGYRYKLHCRQLPGNPDLVLPKYKTTIFVHGCFWHSHNGCLDASTPKSNVPFWEKKFSDNIKRFHLVKNRLAVLQWKVIVIWECEIEKNLGGVIQKTVRRLA